ncbi:aminotransferase class V [Roseibium sp. TrichSKD4]|uniref:aminotransferase class V-fold PLP-dependent enzyme n=1 Tax=Roseibium sp. TrichSKD4 TaxID=744980 RepID=UPI0001E5763B|nr:aminotransferase class V-fold PLP-dependent enzyme [Roseibium sp. TrichSKD4]EFO29448.1 aminotransferase class V [Roseibium sp. TrichSKD4]
MTHMAGTALDDFKASLKRDDLVEWLRAGLIGDGIEFETPFGPKELIYADYVASGRALRQIEDFVMERVLPFYANSHTEASHVGGTMTRMREQARREIARIVGADDDTVVAFAGSGATSGINRLVHLLGASDASGGAERPWVVIGPYEHHSNILPWRESGAEVVEIAEAPTGGPDLDELENVLASAGQSRLKIGAFSQMSNVTGIVTDVDAVTRILNRHGARSLWDCAGSGSYLPISMDLAKDTQKDALVYSPHKFIGGPAATGVIVLRKEVVMRAQPVFPGGGTVRFVSPWAHDYSDNIATREEAGTPNVVGDIRAALVFLVREALMKAGMHERHKALRARAMSVWAKNPAIEIMGNEDADMPLPIFSFRVRDMKKGGYLHQQLVTRMLSDLYGVQARGGCACAGPYAHRLLGMNEAESEKLRAEILSGKETLKPGWTRLNLSVLHSGEKADRIIHAVDELATDPYPMCDWYECDHTTARFRPVVEAA